MRKLFGLTLLVLCNQFVTLAQPALSVINGARFELPYPVSPGAYAQAYGTFQGVTATTAGVVPLPTELGGVRVLVNDVAAPLYAAGPSAMSFVVPKGTRTGRATVRVVRGSDVLGSGNANVVPVSPGIFFALGDPLAQGGILNQASQYAVQGAPARKGQTIQIFATGQGAVDVDVADGATPATLARTVAATKVYISVDEAQVTFSGLSPQFPGLWQINAVIPDKPYISGQVPVVVTLDGVPSNQVSFWVAQ